MLKPSQTWAGQFTVLDATGALVNADSLPTGALVLDGANDAATVTIANVSTGVYSFSVTIPAGATAGQFAQMRIAATISTITTGAMVADALIDTERVSDLTDLDAAGVRTAVGLASANLDTQLAAIIADTGTDIPALIGALNDLAASDITEAVIEGSLTLDEILRILLAFVAGTTTGGGSSPIVFKSQDGLISRISMTVDSDGDRSAVTVDGA